MRVQVQGFTDVFPVGKAPLLQNKSKLDIIPFALASSLRQLLVPHFHCISRCENAQRLHTYLPIIIVPTN